MSSVLTAELQGEIERTLRGTIHYDVPMSDHTSLRIGGPADAIAEPVDGADLGGLLRALSAREICYAPLGNGTNLLVRDGGYRGVLIRMKPAFGAISLATGQPDAPRGGEVDVDAGAGAELEGLVAFATELGLVGLAFAAGIPGTVGGAVAMNAGAFGCEMKDVVTSVDLVGPDGACARKAASSEGRADAGGLRFAYRNLDLPAGSIIVAARLKLRPSDREAVVEEVARNRAKRRRRQPLGLPSAGSTFKNPPEAPAGLLIEQAGLKGARIGGAVISERHANFICNEGGATAADVLALIEMARARVLESRGVHLEPEIRIVGEEP